MEKLRKSGIKNNVGVSTPPCSLYPPSHSLYRLFNKQAVLVVLCTIFDLFSWVLFLFLRLCTFFLNFDPFPLDLFLIHEKVLFLKHLPPPLAGILWPPLTLYLCPFVSLFNSLCLARWLSLFVSLFLYLSLSIHTSTSLMSHSLGVSPYPLSHSLVTLLNKQSSLG